MRTTLYRPALSISILIILEISWQRPPFSEDEPNTPGRSRWSDDYSRVLADTALVILLCLGCSIARG